jgi:translocation and assembly module TamA
LNISSWQWLAVSIFLLCAVLPLHAQSAPSYIVQINGAGNLTRLLEEHLEIRRRQSDPDLPVEQVQRLADITPQQIRELLATEGYFSPAIDYTLDRQGSPWVARFNINLGAPTIIDTVAIHFSGELADGPHADQQRQERLRRQWSLEPGEIFTQARWSDAKSTLLKNLLNRLYPAARIADSEARIDPEKHIATLTVNIDSGPAFTFGQLEIKGLQRYSPDMIERLNPIQPGDPYSQEKLSELQSRLQDSGYFSSAFATIEVDPAQSQHVPVHVDLTENKRKRLSLGGGFSTDTGARAQAKWLDRNFLGRNWRLESDLRIDRETRLLGADVFLPALANGWLPSFGAHYERTDTAGELDDKIRTGARVSSPDKLNESVWAMDFLADRQQIANADANNRQALIGSYTYTMRRLNNPINPRRGYVASATLGAGLRGVGNEKSLVRAVGRVTWLSPTVQRWQAVLRGEIGQVFGADRTTVPGDLLFRTGGDQTVRGYAYNSLGVLQNGAVVGGTVTAVISAELVYQLTPAWGAAVFTDAGNAADSWGDFRLKQGSGVGARWRSPIGPVNIDLAYGHATRTPRLHFSVGYGF